MSSAEKESPEKMDSPARALPEVKIEETADEEKFYCPPPYMLALMTVALSAMSSVTVAGSLLFVLAAPEKVSPHCYQHDKMWVRNLCVTSTLAFWTYPVVCCLFVVLVYAKNMVDQRTYYEFLLHKVVTNYGKLPAYKNPVIITLAVYAIVAFSSLIWFYRNQTKIEASHIYGSMAYVSPIISFLAVLFSKWFVQDNLITLPNFVEEYDWALEHLNKSKSYAVNELHAGFELLEHNLNKSDETNLDIRRMVALTEHYTKEVITSAKAIQAERNAGKDKADAEAGKDKADGEREGPGNDGVVDNEMLRELRKARKEEQDVYTKTVYWEVRLLFNPRLQDDRSRSFVNWAIAIMLITFLAIVLSVILYISCVVTCLEIERVLTPDSLAWPWTHKFSLRPDLQEEHQSLKQLATRVAMSAMQTGARSIFRRAPPGGLLHFQLGAAA
jgi:hypothetical protein